MAIICEEDLDLTDIVNEGNQDDVAVLNRDDNDKGLDESKTFGFISCVFKCF